MVSCEDAVSVAPDKISTGLDVFDDVSAITRNAGSIPVAVTVPAVMTAVSPEAGATCGVQLPSAANAPSDPFQVLTVTIIHDPTTFKFSLTRF
jgi:hypothetical protein